MTERTFLHIGKSGQSPTTVFFQVQIVKHSPDMIWRQKAYLIFYLTGKKGQIKLAHEKPKDTSPSQLCTSILRKNIPTGQIEQILPLENGDFIAPVHIQKKLAFFLRLDNSGPVFFELIAANHDSILRYGPSGTFSKRKTALKPFDESSWLALDNRLPALILDLSTLESQDKKENDNPMQIGHFYLQQHIKKRLKRRLKTINKSLREQKAHQASPQDTFKLEREIKHLEQHDFIKENQPNSIGRQLSELYALLKKKKRSTTLAGEQIAQCQREIKALTEDLAITEGQALEEAALLAIAAKWRLNPPKNPSQASSSPAKASPYFKFLVDGQLLLVAKNAELGDKLLKSAKGNDLWFHIAGQKGAHILAPFSKDEPSGKAKHAGAILALFYAKNKESSKGEVYIAKRHHLKKDGPKTGLWKIEKAQTLTINYTQSELQEILQTKLAKS